MNKKLFLSYGHPEASICQKICDHLRANGFDVWMDLDDIKEGNDWRRKIFEGISESNGVLACLSRHSCRKPGVCLNELSIAVGVKGGNIKTILLENEEEVVPPAELCHSQWLDMHDWKEWKSRGNEAFEDWFSSKMKTLVEMLKRDGEFAGEIESVRKILNPLISRSRQSALLAKAFWGRAWLADEVEKWLRDNDADRMLVLYGEPGIGKSAFAANYMHYHEKVVGGIFCERNHVHFNDPENIIRSISYQLACRLPAYRKALIQIFGNGDNLKDKTVSELFDMLLSEPLQHLYIDGGHETLCFIIDGLDECGDEKDNDLARTLKQYADRLPNWLRFLVTTRELASVTSIFGNMNSMKLQGSMERNMVDIRTYYESCLETELQQIPSESERNKVLDRLTEASKGVFLYAELMANSIHNGNQSITDLEHFPEGLSAMFYQWFEGSFPKHEEYEQKYRRFISTMLAIPEGIPTNMVTSLLGVDENREHDILLKMQILLANNTNWLGEKTWKFSHQYIGEWIQGEESGRFYCSANVGADLVGRYLQEKYQKDSAHMISWEMFTFLDDSYDMEESVKTRVLKDNKFLEQAVSLADTYALDEEVFRARVCYERLEQFVYDSEAQAESQLGRMTRKKLARLSEGIEKRLGILDRLDMLVDGNMKDQTMGQMLEKGKTADLVEMVRESLKSGYKNLGYHILIDDIADSVLFRTFEQARIRMKEGIKELKVQERDRKQFRGPVLTIPMTLIVVLLTIARLYFAYLDGINDPDYAWMGHFFLRRQIFTMIFECAVLLAAISYYKKDLSSVGKTRAKSIRHLISAMLWGVFLYIMAYAYSDFVFFAGLLAVILFYWLWDYPKEETRKPQKGYWGEIWFGILISMYLLAKGSMYYLRSLIADFWPLIIMALSMTLLYKEETEEMKSQKHRPLLWSAVYYGIAIILLSLATYNVYIYGKFSWTDYTDQIRWIYMLLVADTAYLLFARPNVDELVKYSKRMHQKSLFDLDLKEGMDEQEIMNKIRAKMPHRIVMTIFANLAAMIGLILMSPRVREIAISLYHEIMGYDSYRNLGWLSHRMNAVSQSYHGDYSALNSQSFISQDLPLSWIHHHYGMTLMLAALGLCILLLIFMKRYMQPEIESRFVISVQKLIMFSFVFQTVLGIAAELFLFTNTTVKVIFLGDSSSLLLWILFMRIGKSRNRKRLVKKEG